MGGGAIDPPNLACSYYLLECNLNGFVRIFSPPTEKKLVYTHEVKIGGQQGVCVDMRDLVVRVRLGCECETLSFNETCLLSGLLFSLKWPALLVSRCVEFGLQIQGHYVSVS